MIIQVNTTRNILEQIRNVILQMDDSSYSLPVNVLSGNTVGKHIRHILEFFDCLNKGYISGAVDYDTRKRNLLLETSVAAATEQIDEIISFTVKATDKPYVLLTRYPGSEIPANSATSYKRELIYNIEHAIHHMAMIKIALKSEFHEVNTTEEFGVAFSTIKYNQTQCAL